MIRYTSLCLVLFMVPVSLSAREQTGSVHFLGGAGFSHFNNHVKPYELWQYGTTRFSYEGPASLFRYAAEAHAFLPQRVRITTESYRFGAEKFFTDSEMFSFTIDGFNYRFLQRCNVYCGGLWELPFMDRYGKGTSYDDVLILISSTRLIRHTTERYNTQGISIGLNMHLMRGQTMDPFLGVSSGIGACAFGRQSQGGCRAYLYGAHIGLRYHVTKEIFLLVQTEIHRVELRFVDYNRNDIYLLPSPLKQWMFGVGVTAF